MSEAFQPDLDFEAAAAARETDEALVLDLDGFEGPLDVLLALARRQKVDLLRLSIGALADQYLAFVRQARQRNFALAADYLVMAAWLAFLKSRLLLPRPERAREEEASPEAAAATLAFRLARLDAIRRAGEALAARPRLGREVFGRGDPEARVVVSRDRMAVDLHELVSAYVDQRARSARRVYAPTQRVEAYALGEARARLQALAPALSRWTALAGLAPAAAAGGPGPASCLASTFSASLELVKEGRLEARQLAAFEELYVRARTPAAPAEPAESAA